MEYKYKIVNKLTHERTFLYDLDEVEAYIGRDPRNRENYRIIDLSEDLTKLDWRIARKTWKRKNLGG